MHAIGDYSCSPPSSARVSKQYGFKENFKNDCITLNQVCVYNIVNDFKGDYISSIELLFSSALDNSYSYNKHKYTYNKQKSNKQQTHTITNKRKIK